jgi:hypothetical protein
VNEVASEMATIKAQIDSTALEMGTAKSEIQRILADCNTFVKQTRDEANSANAAMLLETNALHEKQQAIVGFVNGVPDTVAALKANLDEVTSFLSSSGMPTFDQRIAAVEVSYEELESGILRRVIEHFRSAAASGGSTGTNTGFQSTGFQGVPFAERDRNVFDVRDYKLAELGTKPTIARWKKWRRDLEGFIDTIGTTWKGISGLLRELRQKLAPFDGSQVQAAITAAQDRGDKAPTYFGFDHEAKKDVLYRLLMPKLDDVLSNELAQVGDEDGFELFRRMVRKLDRPKADIYFELKTDIEGLGKHVCANFQQTVRFLTMLDTRVRDFVLETGKSFPKDSLASVMRRAVDQDTADCMDEANTDLSDFDAVTSLIKKREFRLRSRGGAGAGKGPDAMVYGVSAPELAQPPCPPGLSAAEA